MTPEDEIRSFQGLWQGGYYEGDPLLPMAASGYGPLGYMSVLHAVYLCCMKPYLTPATRALEIGPGRGAWTRALLSAGEVWCLDAVSAEENRFWEYVGPAPHVRYRRVSDFSCSMLPDDHFDYLFSFGTFCHISFPGMTEYLRNLYPKLRRGAHAFLMVADYRKYRAAWADVETLSVANVLPQIVRPRSRVLHHLVRLVLSATGHLVTRGSRSLDPRDLHEGDDPTPGRWYDAGTERTCRMLTEQGYSIVDPDVGVLHRDPIVHFSKP